MTAFPLPLRKSLLPALLAGAAASALTGCASLPKLGAAPVAQPIGHYATAESLAAPARTWPADRWWAAYGDGQLDALIDEAVANAPDLAVAHARARKAEALAQQAGAALAPQLGFDASVMETKQSYNNGVPQAFVPHGWNDAGQIGLDAGWQLDFFGRNRAVLAAATSSAEAARVEAAEARLQISTAVAAAWAELSALYAERDATEQALNVRQQTEALIRDRVDHGLENEAAEARTRSQRAAEQSRLAAIDEAIGLTKHRLAALAGQGPDRALSVGRPSIGAVKAFGLPGDLQADLIGRRPDIVASRLMAEAAADRIQAARADFYPNVNLSAFVGAQSLGLDLLGKSGSSTGQAGLALSLPIFEGGRLRGAYRGARADYDAAVATYNGTLTRALNEVADVATSSRALSLRLTPMEDSAAAARRAWEVTSNRYRGGLATYLEVLTAEDAMIAAQRAEANLRTRAFALDVALVRALGGGFQSASRGL